MSRAVIDKHSNKRYFLNKILHREYGPAAEFANGDKRWYLFGEEVTKEYFLKHFQKN